MKRPFIIPLLYLVACAGCAPRIATTVMKTYPALDAGEPVAVYSQSQPVPDNSEALGTVAVTDGGFTMPCDSLTMMTRMQEEAKKIGGNAIFITEHLRPMLFGSNCHQFKGTVLRIANVETAAGAPDDSLAVRYVATPPGRRLPRWGFGVDAGAGWRTNSMDPALESDWKHFYNSLRFGVSWDAHGHYFFTDEIGLQLIYQGSQATYSDLATLLDDDGNVKASGRHHSAIRTHYAGPAMICRAASPKKKWLFDATIGVGYLYYEEAIRFPSYFTVASGSTFAIQTSLGVAYKWDEHWGVGVNLSNVSCAIRNGQYNDNGHKSSLPLDDEGKGNGVSRLEMLIGLRYYIK